MSTEEGSMRQPSKICGHLVVGEHGRCENCFEFVGKPGDVAFKAPPKPEHDVLTEAKTLATKAEKQFGSGTAVKQNST